MAEAKKILIVAKTYPLPSNKYKELVCTGGVLEDGRFIRIYPLNYRYRAYHEQFKKYQWIKLEIEKHTGDVRPESYRPVEGAKIQVLGKPLDTDNNWAKRKEFVFAGGISVMCELEKLPQTEKSIGIIKPKIVMDVLIKQDNRDWKPRWKALFDQYELFGPDRKPLEKIPYKFKYHFICEQPNCKGHTKTIFDWEVGQLYRRLRDEYGSESVATEKVRDKLLNHLCGPTKDTYFFVGTTRKHGSWVVVGVFYPKKTP